MFDTYYNQSSFLKRISNFLLDIRFGSFGNNTFHTIFFFLLFTGRQALQLSQSLLLRNELHTLFRPFDLLHGSFEGHLSCPAGPQRFGSYPYAGWSTGLLPNPSRFKISTVLYLSHPTTRKK